MKLKKLNIFFLFLLVATVFSGCATSMQTNHLISKGDLSEESMKILARPTEYGINTIGEAEGEAYTKKFLWFTIDGANPEVDLLIKGDAVNDPLESFACFKAVKSLDGDGFYKTTSEWSKYSSFLWIIREKRVKVTGKVFKLKDFGIIDAERADKMRKWKINSSDSKMHWINEKWESPFNKLNEMVKN